MGYDIFLCVTGLVVLSLSADLLVKKASLIAQRFRVSPFVVGALILGMGTSAPEWAISSLASLQGLPHLALGNVMGSNIFNIFIVLSLVLFSGVGESKPSEGQDQWDHSFLFLTSMVLIFMFSDLVLKRWEAFLLVLVFGIYMVFRIKKSSVKTPSLPQSASLPKSAFLPQGVSLPQSVSFPGGRQSTPLLTKKGGGIFTDFLLQFKNSLWGVGVLIVLSFVFLVFGSHLTIQGAVGVGQFVGLSERVIGVLMVSVGTSLPELVISFVAIIKSQKNMALGNVIGSNVFNTYAILGTSGLIAPVEMERQVLTLDLPVLLTAYVLLFFVLCLPFGCLASFRKVLKKILPFLFLAGYGVYISYLLWM